MRLVESLFLFVRVVGAIEGKGRAYEIGGTNLGKGDWGGVTDRECDSECEALIDRKSPRFTYGMVQECYSQVHIWYFSIM